MIQTAMFRVFVLSCAATVVLTPLCWMLLRRFGFWNAMDSEHDSRIVRGGGISVAAAFLLCGYILCFFPGFCVFGRLNLFVPAALIVLGTGIADDRFGLRAKLKLLLQTAAILLIWLCGYRIRSFLGWEMPWYASFAFTWLWGVAILNGFNLIDGLDGLCTGSALICSVVMFVLACAGGNAVILSFSILFAGCCTGFLIFNFHPAKLFLGDTGSLFLGLTCLYLSLGISGGVFDFHRFSALLLVFWIPFCDLGLAVWRRKVKSLLKNTDCCIMERDMNHLHYRLLGVTHSHRLTVEIIWFGMLLIDSFAMLIWSARVTALTFGLFLTISLFSLVFFARYEFSYTFCFLRHAALCLRSRRMLLVPCRADGVQPKMNQEKMINETTVFLNQTSTKQEDFK